MKNVNNDSTLRKENGFETSAQTCSSFDPEKQCMIIYIISKSCTRRTEEENKENDFCS